MRILFLHEVGYFEKPIFEMHEFPEHLSARGHEVAFADYLEVPRSRKSVKFGYQVTGRVVAVAQLRHYSQVVPFSGISGRLLAALTFKFFFLKVLRDFQPDIIVTYAVPTSGLQAARLARRLDIPIVYRALDVSHKIRKTLFAPLVKHVERRLVRAVDGISANNPAMMSYLEGLGAPSEKVSVELPPLNLEHFSGKTSEATVGHKGSSDHIRLVYMGSFFYFSGLEEVIHCLVETPNTVSLLLVGGGERDGHLRRLVHDLKLDDRVYFAGFVPYLDLPEYLRSADVAINPMIPSLVSNAALPNKVLQYMALGLPVVSTRLSGLSSLFTNEVGVRIVSDPEKVVSEALRMAADPNLKELGRQNRESVAAKFDVSNCVYAFENRLLMAARRK